MKNILILLACLLVVSVAFAEPNHKKLEIAMKYHGVELERDGQFMFVAAGTGVSSMYLGEEVGTGYLEQGEKKIFWKIEPIEGGVKITITVNILGKEYTKIIYIKFDNAGTMNVQALSEDRYDWMCILQCAGSAAFKCISCGTDWKCWAICAGPSVVQCVMGCF